MANNKKKNLRGKRRNNSHSVEYRKGRGFRGYFLAFLFGEALIAGLFFAFGGNFIKEASNKLNTPVLNLSQSFASTSIISKSSEVRSLHQLLTMTPDELEQVDIALVNLLCAKGLNGTEKLDIEKCLSTIDKWAELIRADTQNRLSLYYSN